MQTISKQILERINKDRLEELNKDEIEYYAETQNLKQQFIDNNDMEVIHNRLMEGKAEIILYTLAKKTKEERIIPFNTEIADLRREAGYLERIRAYLTDLFINLDSVERLLKHTDKEIEDINDRVGVLEFEKEQINDEV